MAKNPNPDGTTITVDPVPDAVLDNNPEHSYDSDFNDLGSPAPDDKKLDAPATEAGGDTPAPNKKDGETTTPLADKKTDESSVTVDTDKILADNELQSLKDQITSLTAENKKLENAKAAIAELEREPLVFLRKYVPNIAEKISPESYIKSKLQAEFSPTFKYDPSEAYDEGTQSYKWRLREAEIRDQLMRENARLEADKGVALREREASFKVQKDKVMKTYGLDETRFKTEVQDWSLNKQVTLEDIAKLRYFDQIIKAAVEKATKHGTKVQAGTEPKVPGVNDLTGGDQTDSSKAYAEMQTEFGDM